MRFIARGGIVRCANGSILRAANSLMKFSFMALSCRIFLFLLEMGETRQCFSFAASIQYKLVFEKTIQHSIFEYRYRYLIPNIKNCWIRIQNKLLLLLLLYIIIIK
jgi:hypothetical protein